MCSRVTRSASMFCIFTFPRGLFPWPSLAQCGTSDCIVGHKNTGCSLCTLVSPVICISSGLADQLLTSVCSAVAVSCSKVLVLFLISHYLHSLPCNRVFSWNMFCFSVCLINHVIILSLVSPIWNNVWYCKYVLGVEARKGKTDMIFSQGECMRET